MAAVGRCGGVQRPFSWSCDEVEVNLVKDADLGGSKLLFSTDLILSFPSQLIRLSPSAVLPRRYPPIHDAEPRKLQ